MKSKAENTFKVYEVCGKYENDCHCGPGSTLSYTESIRSNLIQFLNKYNITSIFDCPCGDFNWMSTLDFGDIKYLGGDVIQSMVQLNSQLYPGKQFTHFDLLEDALPKVDLLFCRDCLFHFSKEDKLKVLQNFINSGIKYIMITDYPNCSFNEELETGDFKEFNWKLFPFNFPDPLDVIDDTGITDAHAYSVRKMNLYSRDHILAAFMPSKRTYTKEQSFKGKSFIVSRGDIHPEYSYYTFEQEEHNFRDKYWNIKEGDVVFDAGASYGSYTLTAGAMGAYVYSFEPEPTVFCDLVKNITLNGWQGKCYPFNEGLYSEETNINMKSYAPHWPDLAISQDYHMTTLDKFMQDYNICKLDWMKIDVEGVEENVITGGINSIRKYKPKMIIECHNFLNPKISENVKELLLSLGDYEFEEIPRDTCLMLYASPKVSK
jgi:FkbM family methyltransferase